MYRQALEVKIEVLGAEHIDVANTQNNIAANLHISYYSIRSQHTNHHSMCQHSIWVITAHE